MSFEPSSKEHDSNKSQLSAENDGDFDPTAEMLVNDFDDEHTLDEEEAMESAESVTNELDDLQREGEMPLNELLAMYGYDSENAPAKVDSSSLTKNLIIETEPPKLETSQTSAASSKEVEMLPTPFAPPLVMKDDDEEEEAEIITVPDDPPEVPSSTGPLLRSVSQASESSETGTDDDYSPDDDWRKTIQVGSDFQAAIPEGLCKYDDAPAYENEDRLLWDPHQLDDEKVEEYLRQSQHPLSSNLQGVNAVPLGSHTRDDEQALFLLLQCGQNVEEALRRRRMQSVHPSDSMSLWSEDECRSFETGLRMYGKDFHMIQQNKVRTRSVGELVQFYYLWKKTERHDIFASKHRMEKKKYSLHPGTTDYMDRFLDEQENPPSHRDRSLSPSMHSLMYTDNRKRTPASSPPVTGPKSDINSDHSHQQGGHSFLGTLYPPGTEKFSRVHSPNKLHPNNHESSSSINKEFINGEDRYTTVTSPKDKKSSLDVPVDGSTNIQCPLNTDKNVQNPPSDVSCTRRTTDTSLLNDTNTRFDTCREVTSIE